MHAILDMKNKESGMLRKAAKETWIKTSFWMPENAEEELKREQDVTAGVGAAEAKEEKPHMVCPYLRKRPDEAAERPYAIEKSKCNKLRFKDLITLKMAEDE